MTKLQIAKKIAEGTATNIADVAKEFYAYATGFCVRKIERQQAQLELNKKREDMIREAKARQTEMEKDFGIAPSYPDNPTGKQAATLEREPR